MNIFFDKLLWILFAATIPLFGVNFLRIEYNDLTISIPVAILWLIIFHQIFFNLNSITNNLWRSKLHVISSISLAIWLFFCWHLISAMAADDTGLALKELIKIFMGILSFYAVFFFFPRDLRFLGRFWVVAIWSMAVLLAFLIYVYAFVFNSAFLGSNLDYQTNSNRNQLAWVLTLMYPFALTYFLNSKNRLFAVIPLIIFTISLIYMGSRGAWVATGLGVTAVGVLLSLTNKKYWQLFIGMLLLSLLLVGSFVSLEKLATGIIGIELNYRSRFLSLLGQEELGAYSIEIRKMLINSSLEAFANSPITGIGLTNFLKFNDLVSHNDWLKILAELGIIGLMLFTIFLLIPILKIMHCINIKHIKYIKNNFNWILFANIGSFIAIIVYLSFMNIFTTVPFWIFIGFIFINLNIIDSLTCFY